MDERKFVKSITRMFDKKSVLRNVDEYVTDGYIMYKGDLVQDIFYRLRLEAIDQTQMELGTPQDYFEAAKEYTQIDIALLYTVISGSGEEFDVFEVGNETKKPHIALRKKYRKLFSSMNSTYKTNYEPYTPEFPLLKSPVYILTEFGQMIIQPASLPDEKIFR